MMLNKLVKTKTSERIFIIGMTEQEFEDTRSAIELAIPEAMRKHKDSPSFRKAIHKLERSFKTISKDALNREKQKGL